MFEDCDEKENILQRGVEKERENDKFQENKAKMTPQELIVVDVIHPWLWDSWCPC